MAIDYVEHLRSHAAALAAAARQGPLETPVPSCPGWDLAALSGHVGRIHRWAAAAVREGARPDSAAIPRPPDDRAAVAGYLADGTEELLGTLAGRAPSDACWSFAGDQPASVGWWARRQAIETAVHHWDAGAALGETPVIDAALAADGIDELFDVFVPLRYASHDGLDIGGSVHLHCTDTEGEWTFRTDDGVFQVTRGHVKGDAAVRGPASALLLLLTHRVSVDDPSLEVLGDASVVDRWLALGPIP
jgi:uncharacterized protein (TIGR03083 family)